MLPKYLWGSQVVKCTSCLGAKTLVLISSIKGAYFEPLWVSTVAVVKCVEPLWVSIVAVVKCLVPYHGTGCWRVAQVLPYIDS